MLFQILIWNLQNFAEWSPVVYATTKRLNYQATFVSLLLAHLESQEGI